MKLDPVLAEIRATREAESGGKVVNRSPRRLQPERTMQIPVLVEPVGQGRFKASSVRPFASVAEGSTHEEVIAKIRVELAKEVEAGKSIVMVDVPTKEENPWLRIAGSLKDCPLFDEWREAVEEYRRQCDIDAGVDYEVERAN